MNFQLSAAQIEQMKRNAKRVAASDNIPHSAALDLQANKAGYSSWALLMKSRGPDLSLTYRFERSVEEMRQALRPRAAYGVISPADARPVEIVSHLMSMPHAVQYAIDFMNCLLQAMNVTVDKTSLAYHEMRTRLPYVAEFVGGGKYLLVNRGYDPVGKMPAGHSDYRAYPHMHAELSDEQLEVMAFRPGESGAIFNDGTQPWASSALAAAYTARLERFYATLTPA